MKDLIQAIMLIAVSVVVTASIMANHSRSAPTLDAAATKAEIAGLMTTILRLEWRVKILEAKLRVISPHLQVTYSGGEPPDAIFQDEKEGNDQNGK